jgi:hypothetical protein
MIRGFSGGCICSAVVLAGCQTAPPPRLSGSLKGHDDAAIVSAYAEAETHWQRTGGVGGLEQELYVSSLRNEFLQHRAEKLGWSEDERRMVFNRSIAAGMNEDMVLVAWGMPWFVGDPERSPLGEVERWYWGWDSVYTAPWREVTLRDGVVVWWTERSEGQP